VNEEVGVNEVGVNEEAGDPTDETQVRMAWVSMRGSEKRAWV